MCREGKKLFCFLNFLIFFFVLFPTFFLYMDKYFVGTLMIFPYSPVPENVSKIPKRLKREKKRKI